MSEHKNKISTKAKLMHKDIVDFMGTIISMNKLFSFGNEKTFLKEEVFNKLSKIGLLRKDRGHFPK